jgi:hypothetical protein
MDPVVNLWNTILYIGDATLQLLCMSNLFKETKQRDFYMVIQFLKHNQIGLCIIETPLIYLELKCNMADELKH